MWTGDGFHDTKRPIRFQWHDRQVRVIAPIFSFNTIINPRVVQLRREIETGWGCSRGSSRGLCLVMMMWVCGNLHVHVVGREWETQPVIITIHRLHPHPLFNKISIIKTTNTNHSKALILTISNWFFCSLWLQNSWYEIYPAILTNTHEPCTLLYQSKDNKTSPFKISKKNEFHLASACIFVGICDWERPWFSFLFFPFLFYHLEGLKPLKTHVWQKAINKKQKSQYPSENIYITEVFQRVFGKILWLYSKSNVINGTVSFEEIDFSISTLVWNLVGQWRVR